MRILPYCIQAKSKNTSNNCIAIMMVVCLITVKFSARSQTCGAAVQNLQNYAASVNNIYNAEYFQVIPNNRCPPKVDMWGRPFIDQQVLLCRNQFLYQLNAWYVQQCQAVNGYAQQIQQTCLMEQYRPDGDVIDVDDSRTTREKRSIPLDNVRKVAIKVDKKRPTDLDIPKTAEGAF
jgi:hypothetical protein